MLQRAILVIAIFLVILVALTFGDALLRQAYEWISWLINWVMYHFADIFAAIRSYLFTHTTKVVLAIVLTVPISWWVFRNKDKELGNPANHRKIAIVLAIFLGWLGAHRFYLGQIGWGIVYLLILWFFSPLAVVLGLIDALRYFFMTDEQFAVARS